MNQKIYAFLLPIDFGFLDTYSVLNHYGERQVRIHYLGDYTFLAEDATQDYVNQ